LIGEPMKKFAEAGRRKLFSFLTSRLASAGMVASVALIAASGAKADVVETFNLSGSLTSFFGAEVAFYGTIDLDFSSDFSSETATSVNITVPGRADFTESPSAVLATSAKQAVIDAYNSSGDLLTLTFATPNPSSWAGFNTGMMSGGEVIFGGVTGFLFVTSGVVTRDSSDLAILAPPLVDPPSLNDPPPGTPAAVPELSTWAMMLVGLGGLGLAAKRRRAFNVLSERA
jgi:hypothetical protein